METWRQRLRREWIDWNQEWAYVNSGIKGDYTPEMLKMIELDLEHFDAAYRERDVQLWDELLEQLRKSLWFRGSLRPVEKTGPIFAKRMEGSSPPPVTLTLWDAIAGDTSPSK